MKDIIKHFPLSIDTLFQTCNNKFALVYTQTEVWLSSDFDERGNWDYTRKIHTYEQVEYFNDIPTMKKRQIELSKISNKRYSNFTAHINPKYNKSNDTIRM